MTFQDRVAFPKLQVQVTPQRGLSRALALSLMELLPWVLCPQVPVALLSQVTSLVLWRALPAEPSFSFISWNPLAQKPLLTVHYSLWFLGFF